MKFNKLNSIILLGFVATVGILVAQLVWIYQAYSLEEKKFAQKVHIALLEVARKIYENNGHEVLTKDLIQRVSNDYYVVNVNDDIQPEILEHYLKTELTKFNILTDFEFAIYNCESDDMMYGKYISIDDKGAENKVIEFPKYKDLIYYFAIRFPNEHSHIIGSLRFWFFYTGALVLVLLIYIYSIYSLLQQKKYSELQRDFINNMTHEFKTPLSSILLASNYLSDQKEIKENSKLDNYTHIIINQGKKLNNHIEKILNIARNDQSALEIHPVKFKLYPFLEQIIDSYQLKHENLTVHLEVDPEIILKADEFHFSNIVQNLLDNSIKYSDGHPEITISSNRTPKGIQLDFQDMGVGVDPKNIQFIFDKFYREANKKSNEVTGFGLGLYYVKRISQQHNWKVWASCPDDGGLKISILIPK